MKSATFYVCATRGACKISHLKIFLAYVLRSQYLFVILRTSVTVKNAGNEEKSGCFGKTFLMERVNVFSISRRDISLSFKNVNILLI